MLVTAETRLRRLLSRGPARRAQAIAKATIKATVRAVGLRWRNRSIMYIAEQRRVSWTVQEIPVTVFMDRSRLAYGSTFAIRSITVVR